MDLLTSYTPTPEAQKLFKELIIRVWKRELQTINNKEKSLHRALERLRTQKQQAISKVVNGELTGIEKDEYVLTIDAEVKNVQNRLSAVSSVTSLKEGAIDYAISFIGNAPRIWNNASVEHKIIYQRLLFPQGLPYNLQTNHFGTAEMSPLYRLVSIKKDPSKSDESHLVTSRRI